MSGVSGKMILWLTVLLHVISYSYSEYIPPGPRYRCPVLPEKIRLLHPCVCEQGTDSGLYVTCENSGLATLSVGLGNLATLDMPVEQLILRECHMSKLYGPLLHRLKVRILKIEDTPITKIGENAFYGVNKTLQDFYLINSKLDEFPKEAFKILGNLTYLKIDGHTMSKLDKDIFSNSEAVGKLERLHIINGDLEELQVESFQPLRKLKTLDIHGNKLSVLKKNQFKGLRDAEVLDISYNNITKLESSHIADLTKLSWCNVSHNHLTEMSRGMFARNAVLRVLHLDHNSIKRLDTNSFRGMRFLRRLYLSDNEISDVGRGTFGSVTRIGTIDLARNKIKKIDFQMFHQLNYVEIVDVAENEITEIQKLSFKDLYLAQINISHNSLSKIEVGSFENCANITVLDLSHNNLTHIPARAFDHTTYATELQLSFNQLTELNQVPLQNMSGLKILNVSHNLLHTIPKNTFPKLYELHTVDVSHNVLMEIASSVFQSLFSLRVVDLSYNSLEKVKPSTFGTLPTLLRMDLSHNLLTEISKGALSNLASCRELDVSHNQLEKIFMMPISLGEVDLSYNNISEIPENVWPSMNSLLSLDLEGNPLGGGLGPESFRGLLTLRKLSLVGTGIREPPWQALSVLSSLQYLYLSNNNITSLQKASFGRLPIVFELDLTNNQITNVTEKAFDGLLQLLTLSLRNNNITRIPNGAFFGLVSLRSLDLSQNYLEKIDNKTNGLLDDCLSLERVNLSSNKISTMSRKMFPNDQWIPYKLREVDLSYNSLPVLTHDLTYGTRTLHVLNISHNMIQDIRKGVIGNLTSLKLLDLSWNKISDLSSEKEIFRLPENISAVNLANNELLVLPISLYNATNLVDLDVRNNMLEHFDEKLVRRIKKNNLTVHFQGNPIQCDCFMRPLKHYLSHITPSFLAASPLYSNLTCAGPPSLAEQDFLQVPDDRLNCLDNVGVKEALAAMPDPKDYELEPDINFRDISVSQGAIQVSWYVKSSKDIADFRIIVRNSINEILLIRDIPYNERQLLVHISEEDNLKKALDNKTPGLELCIVGGNSQSLNGNWFPDQCKVLPEITEKKSAFGSGFFWRNQGHTTKSNAFYSLLSVLIVYILF